ncbi:unnamed protein product, partial [Mesorhabditis belari]|uniref:Ig-like domain-containing protein n=1 Tax=Mesorhabditis belari TaxID=2138241 RepID=A0AAF3F5E0_9BILA
MNPDDTGVYLCTASNAYGVESSQCLVFVAEPTGPDAHLVLADVLSDKRAPPKFVRAPAGLIDAPEGSTIKLVAKAIGEPQPRITWKKDGKNISRTNRMYQHYLLPVLSDISGGKMHQNQSSITGEFESHLQIDFVVQKTSGIFQCIAENSEGQTIVETQVIVQRGTARPIENCAPVFLSPMRDMGIVNGHPCTLSCKFKGVPEPEIRWYFIDDNMRRICLNNVPTGWIECSGGDTAELKCERTYRNQQGTYQCVASNRYGESSTQCYLLVGELNDHPAGPPRFIKCLRDVWTPLGEEIAFEVETAGYPLPELRWLHNENLVREGRDVQIKYVSDNKAELKIKKVSLLDLGTYSVEASNIHGMLRTNAALNVGKPRHAIPPEFRQYMQKADQDVVVMPKVAFEESDVQRALLKSASQVRMELRKKGAAPVFVHGLEDLELRAGDSAAVAGQLTRKTRQRIAHAHGHKSAARGLAESILATAFEQEASTSFEEIETNVSIKEEKKLERKESLKEETESQSALDEIRQAIQHRNRKTCRPKFMVRPKTKKQLEEGRSLRLKCAVSANPLPTVYWDKSGMVLETGNKYSIYNDGDFYYLEVHHVSIHDQEPMEVKWIRNNMVVADSSGFKYKKDKNHCGLMIVDAFPEDAGEYICEAKNQWGVARCAMRLEIRSDDKPLIEEPPRIVDAPTNVNGEPGMPVQIRVKVTGHPDPVVEWFKGNTKIINDEKYQLSSDGNWMLLTINEATRKDDGKYRISASNGAGSISHSIDLTVREPTLSDSSLAQPRFTVQPVSVQTALAQKVQLQCSFEGKPTPVVSWFKDENRLQDGVKGYSIETTGNNSILSVVYLEKEHLGEYLCTVRNPYGEDLATAMILLEVYRLFLAVVVLHVFLSTNVHNLKFSSFGSSAALPHRPLRK